MVIKEIDRARQYLSGSILASSPIWSRRLEDVSAAEVSIFLRDARKLDREQEAVEALHFLLSIASELKEVGKIAGIRFGTALNRQRPFTSGELVEILAKMTDERRRAALFALDMGIHPRNLVGLTWGQLKGKALTDLASSILGVIPRHFRLPYVFWETTEGGSAVPMFALEESIQEASGFEWYELSRLYKDMVWIDSQADLEQVIEDVLAAHSESMH